MDIQTIKSWFQRGCKPTASQFAATFDSFWHKDEDIPMTSISGLVSAFLSKANVGHTHTPSDITGLETALKEATTNKMNRDGSNYQGSLSLVSPTVISQWTVRKQDGTQVATNTDHPTSHRSSSLFFTATLAQFFAQLSFMHYLCTAIRSTIHPHPPNIQQQTQSRDRAENKQT